MSKKLQGTICLVAMVMLCFFVRSSFAEEKAAGPDSGKAVEEKTTVGGEEKAATVNGEVITQAELDREIKNIAYRMPQNMQGAPPMTDLREKALENLISRQLLLETSRKAGVKIEDAAVEEKLQNAIQSFPDKKTFEAVLKRENVTEGELKLEIRSNLAIQKYMEDEVKSKIEVSKEEVGEFYEKNPLLFKHPEMVKASHILIKTGEKEDDAKKAEARKKIEEVEKQVKEGKDFAELAKTYSECPSKENGGDLGFFRRGQMVKPFEDVAFSLKPGEVSSIVETQFGYHLIKVSEAKPEGTYPLEEVEPKIKEDLSNRKIQEMVAKKLDELKANAKIEKFVAMDDKKDAGE